MGEATEYDAPVLVVSHFHWDREWYRTMQAFRARLVDAIDQVLDLADADDGYRFVLDGQMIVIEDYVAVRPDNLDRLRRHVEEGRLGIGPWYVQPDSLLPSGESMIRNLLIGRRTGAEFGPVSTVAYVPDSFGHPAQFPQLFAGFGLDGFVYWRGNGSEYDRLGSRWLWRGFDGSIVSALHLTEGYFVASRPSDDPVKAIESLRLLVGRLDEADERPVLLMNGFDHTRPDPHIGDLVEPLAADLGRPVSRVLLDDVVEVATGESVEREEYSGELVGGRVANLLPGVWSARMPLKIANRRCEHLLERWAEPWAALGAVMGLADERASIDAAWRLLLANQAHDSICGCSIDRVHERMVARYDDAEGLAEETTDRVLDHLAGRAPDREVPNTDWSVTVFNASAQARTGIVTVPLDAHPALPMRVGEPDLHPLVIAGLAEAGFTVDGRPARVIESDDPARVRWFAGQRVFDVQFVAHDVPAFGCRAFRLELSDPIEERVDDGSVIEAGDTRIGVNADGTVDIAIGETRWKRLCWLEDVGDRGDSYDFDRVGDAVEIVPTEVCTERRRFASGVAELDVTRHFEVPVGLTDDRTDRSDDLVRMSVRLVFTTAPDVNGVSIRARVDNRAEDHRLRLAFPTGDSVDGFDAASTFSTIRRSTAAVDGDGWMHPPPSTFCHQGSVTVNGLSVVAAGLPEAEVRPNGTLLVTLCRSVGWLARNDLYSRPIPAGPEMATPGAQVLDVFETDIVLLADDDPCLLRDAHRSLRGVLGGPNPLIQSGRSLLSVDGAGVVLSALKPADHGLGVVVRLSNPASVDRTAELRFGFTVGEATRVRLDESPIESLSVQDGCVSVDVPAFALVSMRVSPTPS